MELTGEPDGPPTRVGVSHDRQHERADRHRSACWPACCGAQDDGRGLRRRHLPLRRRHAPAHLSRRLVPQRRRRLAAAAAQRAPVAGAGADLPDRGRLDLHHVHDAEVLAVAVRGDGPRRARRRSALSPIPTRARDEPRRARPTRSIRRSARARRPSGWRSSTACCRPRRSIGSTRRSTATLRARPAWSRPCRIRRRASLRVIANPIRIDGERPAQAACSPLGADNDIAAGQAPA